MATDIVLPRLGWNMEKGSIGEWLKHDGDRVQAGEIIFTVEGDKAVQEVEALDSGILHIPAGSPPPGAEAPVGTLLAHILQPGEPPPAAPSPARTPDLPPPSALVPTAGAVRTAQPAVRVAISPRARRVAGELGIDWAGLAGSGRSGRIVERDVRRAAQARPVAASSQPGSLIQPGASAHVTPRTQVTLTTEADVTELVRLRSHLHGALATVPSYTDMLVKAAAQALAEYPQFCARPTDAGTAAHPLLNVGMTIDTGHGFIVAVIRDAHGKSLRQIARESAQVVEKAQSGGITAQDVQGGAFTVTDLGMYEVDAFTPFIPAAQRAVLGAGRVVAKQVVLDAEAGRLAIRHMMFLSLAFDHHLVDGTTALRFLQRIKQLVEQPYLWLVN